MFSGEFENTIDAKGRVVIPSKFREELGAGFRITKGLQGCTLIMTEQRFEQMVSGLSGKSMTDVVARNLQRFFIGPSVTGEFDSQGRVIIPQTIRSHAKLTKEIITIGLTDSIEIWDKQTYEEYMGSVVVSDDFNESMAQYVL